VQLRCMCVCVFSSTVHVCVCSARHTVAVHACISALKDIINERTCAVHPASSVLCTACCSHPKQMQGYEACVRTGVDIVSDSQQKLTQSCVHGPAAELPVAAPKRQKVTVRYRVVEEVKDQAVLDALAVDGNVLLQQLKELAATCKPPSKLPLHGTVLDTTKPVVPQDVRIHKLLGTVHPP
jgi:hypothetical protein